MTKQDEMPEPTIYMDDCGTWSNYPFEDMDGVYTYVRKDPATVAVPVEVIEQVMVGLQAVKDLMFDSFGVYGLHLNGDNSPWKELRTGGRFEEWLLDFDVAVTALQPYTKGGVMMLDKAYIAIWDGKCQAIAAADMPDVNKHTAKWLKQGAAEILLLPKEEAKDRFIKDFK